MPTEPDIASLAALIGEPARAAILLALLGGRALTATELAARADVSPSTASGHLGKLAAGRLVVVEASGRHRYYRLAGPEVARLLEALGAVAQPPRPIDRWERDDLRGLRFARTCYDHLAGWLGVAVAAALVDRRLLRDDAGAFALTPDGERWFAALGVDLPTIRAGCRPLVRRCIDWSERRPHLAGALGAATARRMFDLGWIEQIAGERLVVVTPTGRQGLTEHLGLDVPDRH